MKHFILDTHIFIWLVTGELKRIRPAVLQEILDLKNKRYLSVITVAEVELKIAVGKLSLETDWEVFRAQQNCEWLELKPSHAKVMSKLPLIHRDPFDRMLAAQALAENFTLVTHDELLLQYPIKTLRA